MTLQIDKQVNLEQSSKLLQKVIIPFSKYFDADKISYKTNNCISLFDMEYTLQEKMSTVAKNIM